MLDMPNEETRKVEQEEEGVRAQTAQDAELEALKRQCEEYLAGWKRAQADYANLARETERSKQEFAKFASEQTLLKLLPVIDQFETAMQFMPRTDTLPEADRASIATWHKGLEAIRTLWEQAAKDLGLERVAANGPLDPSVHEALTEESSQSIPSGHVVRAVQNGWTLNGRLIRPAKVIVSKGPS